MQIKRVRYGAVVISAAIIFLLNISQTVHGQLNTTSPYTRFGLGDLARQGVGQNLAMGGTGLAMHRNDRINYLNPASFSGLDSTSVYFDFGANTFHNRYKTEEFSNTWWNMNLHHVLFASSVGKHLGLSAGIVPYSSIGYNIKQEYDDLASGEAMDTYYKGDGGIMNFYVGASVKFFDRLSLGVTMNYLMGRLTREREVKFPMNPSYSATSSLENFDLRKPLFTLGLQYKETLGENFFFSVGGVYDLKASTGIKLDYSVINQIYPYDTISLGSGDLITPEYPLMGDTTLRDLSIPQKFGVGLAVGIPDKLTVTGDYYYQDWSGALSGENFQTTTASSIHLGAEFTPDVSAIRGYHKLMTYRVGGYYSNYYLMVNGTQLKDYGITFGLGFPIRTMKSSINVAFTLGTRGTTEQNLVEENYGIITFTVTLHDLWFRKRRFE